MKIILFTPDQATRLARELTPGLETLVALNAELERADTRLEVLGLTLAGASAGNPDARSAAELTQRRAALAKRIREGLETIHERGPVVKDLALGLLDFYSLAGGVSPGLLDEPLWSDTAIGAARPHATRSGGVAA